MSFRFLLHPRYFQQSLVLAIALLCLGNTSTAQTQLTQPVKALLITGGCCHDYSTQKNLIKKGLEERGNFEVTVVQQGGSGTFAKIPLYENPNWAENFDVIIHNECFADVKDTAWIQRILKPHQEGKPAVVIHCAVHCYRDGTDNWFKFCGVTSRGHGAHYSHEVLNGDADHPIMKGWGAAWANPAGELYEIEKVWPTAHPLASAKDRSNGKEQVCAWTNQYGKARVFGTTLGHHNETVTHPRFLDLLTRGTLWACGKLETNYQPLATPIATPRQVRENLALKQSVSVSSEQPGHRPEFAVDGNPKTRWCAEDDSAPQSIQIDLGETKTVTGCDLRWEYEKRAIYKYIVEGSDDGANWTTLVDFSRNENKGYHHEFKAELRYLRVRFLHANAGFWCSLWEISILGTQMVDMPQPDPVGLDLTSLKLPDGLNATVFATPPAASYPVSVCASPEGIIYVCSDKNSSLDREPNRGSILRLRDIDGDGQADESKFFVDNVDSPRCAVWDHDRLYVMHPPHLSAFIDHDRDGHADEQKILIKDIAFGFKDRPADHTSNGVTLGIDGWLYLAIGDFGFMDAKGADGRHLQFRSGGVIRVRPDGKEMQVYSRGTRNILEVAMDPMLNGFTRDNTNDGGGWDIRIHHFSGLENHGYPSLYMNFTDEIVAPLADYGGGSGCGSLYLDEPGFPESLTDVLCTVDWGRSAIFTHRLRPNRSTFSINQQTLASIERATDLDVDANSNLYAASWKGCSYTYAGENVGYLVKIKPNDFTPAPLPNFENESDLKLVEILNSASHRRRMESQRALLRRGLVEDTVMRLEQLASDNEARLASRVAAIFTLKQGLGKESHASLIRLAEEHPEVRAWAIRALADRQTEIDPKSIDTIRLGLASSSPRVQLESIVATARQADKGLANDVIQYLGDEDPLIAHTAVKTLVALQAYPAALGVLDDPSKSSQHSAALQVLHSIHKSEVVDQLIERLNVEAPSSKWRMNILIALCRLCHREGEWKGNSWGTRPDTSGPYYQPEEWSASEKIKRAITRELNSANPDSIPEIVHQINRHKIHLPKATQILITTSGTNPELVSMAIDQLDSSRKLDDLANRFLKDTASNERFDADIRTKAMRVRLETDDDQAWQEALLLAKQMADKDSKDSQARRDLRAAFLRSQRLRRHIPELTEFADAATGIRSRWSELAIVKFSSSKDETLRRSAEKSLNSGWSNVPRREQILWAISILGAKNLETRVRQATQDPNEKIAAAAKRIAEQWNFEPKPTLATVPTIKSLSFEEVMKAVTESKGNAANGALIYANLDCKKCHTIAAGEALRGPYLPNVAKTFNRKQIAEAILKPNKTLAQGFVTTLFYLDNGKTVTGFITRESANEVIYRDAEGEEHRMRNYEIEERAQQTTSLMPEGQVNGLTVAEFASLVSYIESLGN